MIEAYEDERPNGLNQHDSLHWSLLNLQQMRIWSFLMQLRSHIEPVTEVINDPQPLLSLWLPYTQRRQAALETEKEPGWETCRKLYHKK